MPNDHPAFKAGEHVKFANLDALINVQDQFGVDGPQGRLFIHDLLSDDMTIHHGEYIRIKAVSIYHMGTVLYEFDDIESCWLECCIVDRSLLEPSGHDADKPANQFYEVVSDGEEDAPALVHIRGVEDHQIYCSLRKSFAATEAISMGKVSEMRTKANFEARYGFDGYYKSLPEE